MEINFNYIIHMFVTAVTCLREYKQNNCLMRTYVSPFRDESFQANSRAGTNNQSHNIHLIRQFDKTQLSLKLNIRIAVA